MGTTRVPIFRSLFRKLRCVNCGKVGEFASFDADEMKFRKVSNSYKNT